MIQNFSKILKRIIIFVTLVALCTCVIFVSSRPKVAKADALSVAALGVGALAAVLGSYFATAGVQLIFDGGSDTTLTEYFNSIKQEYEEQTQNYNTYFNDNGEFIGTEEDLSLFVSDQGMAYWNMGKDTERWLNDLKNWFVAKNSLSVGTNTVLYNNSCINMYSGSYTFVDGEYSSRKLPSVVDPNGGSATIYITESIVLNVSSTYSKTQSNYIYYNWSFEHLNSGTVISSGTKTCSYNRTDHDIDGDTGIFYSFYSYDGSALRFSAFRVTGSTNTSQQYVAQTADGINLGNLVSQLGTGNISADGTLTEGYQDFQDAIDQSHTDQADNPDAVISVGVNVGTGGLTADEVREIILQMLLDGTLTGTYEGTYENVGEAEQDQGKEETETPTYPEGWVVINGLEDFFPFCIPWDLYSLIALLNVPPEAPKFTYSLSSGGLFEEEQIEVDLSIFDTVAQVFRTMMVIGFVVFLIIKTRDMIRG